MIFERDIESIVVFGEQIIKTKDTTEVQNLCKHHDRIKGFVDANNTIYVWPAPVDKPGWEHKSVAIKLKVKNIQFNFYIEEKVGKYRNIIDLNTGSNYQSWWAYSRIKVGIKNTYRMSLVEKKIIKLFPWCNWVLFGDGVTRLKDQKFYHSFDDHETHFGIIKLLTMATKEFGELKESITVGKMPNGNDVYKVNPNEIKSLLDSTGGNKLKGLVLRPGEGLGMSGLPRIYVWEAGEHSAAVQNLFNVEAAGFNTEDLYFTFYLWKKFCGEKYVLDLATPSNNLTWWQGSQYDYNKVHDIATEWYTPEAVENIKKYFPWLEWVMFSNAIVDLTNLNVEKEINASSEFVARGLFKELKDKRK